MRIDFLCRIKTKEKILFETQKHQRNMNDQAKLLNKERMKEYNPYKG